MATALNWDDGSDNDDDLDEREPWMWGGMKAIIFLIDCTQPMFQPDVDDKTYFQKCIEGYKSTLLTKIKQQEKLQIGLVLYGTKHKGQSGQPDHVTILQDLALPDAERVKDIMNILEDLNDFEKKHGYSDDYSMAEALWLCSRMISSCKSKLSEQTILLLTSTDNPHSGDRKLQHDARTRAQNLAEANIRLAVVPLGLGFNMNLFFKELAQISTGNDDFTTSDKPAEKMEDILELINQRSSTKRTSARLLWSLGGGVKLAVGVYSLVGHRSHVPQKVLLNRTDNSAVETHIKPFNAATGEEVPACDIVKGASVSNRRIVFEKEELKMVKVIQSPGLVLLGFKPIHRIKIHHHISASKFIYPEERRVQGSRTLFAALLDRCLARNVAPVCYFTPRRNASPQMVALLPQEEKLGKNNLTQLAPPGFHVVFLPYADNIRGLEEQVRECPEPEPNMVGLAEELVQNLRFAYNPALIDNPKVQKMWAGIEALALGYEDPPDVPDYTLPDYDQMDAKVGGLAREFMTMAFPEGLDPDAIKKSIASKRAAEKKSLQAESKAKIPKIDIDISNIAALVENNMVNKLKVDQLKQYLREQGISFKGMKKDELVGLVCMHHLQNS